MEKSKSAKKADGSECSFDEGVRAGLCKEGSRSQVAPLLPPQLTCQARSEHPSLAVMSERVCLLVQRHTVGTQGK